jgi:hypothetical protein
MHALALFTWYARPAATYVLPCALQSEVSVLTHDAVVVAQTAVTWHSAVASAEQNEAWSGYGGPGGLLEHAKAAPNPRTIAPKASHLR